MTVGRECPHGDPHCPCNNDDLACNYETLPGSPRDRCYRFGTLDCVCVDHLFREVDATDRGRRYWCSCGDLGISIKYAGSPRAEHGRHLAARQYAAQKKAS